MHGGAQNDDLITEINVVPLVDIVLVLLIIFMVTATFIVKPAIDMELPSADTGERKERNQFSLLLGKNGSVVIGEKELDPANIQEEFTQIFNDFIEEKRKTLETEGKSLSSSQLRLIARNELTMVIQADTEVTHGRVIHFIDEARKVGILKYAFNVDPDAATAEAERTNKPEESDRDPVQ